MKVKRWEREFETGVIGFEEGNNFRKEFPVGGQQPLWDEMEQEGEGVFIYLELI